MNADPLVGHRSIPNATFVDSPDDAALEDAINSLTLARMSIERIRSRGVIQCVTWRADDALASAVDVLADTVAGMRWAMGRSGEE